MRGILAATAVVGVLAIGGLPALALTLADQETESDRSTAASQRPPGPPPWAHGNARGHEKPGQDDRDKGRQEDKSGAPGWMRHDGRVPPGWTRNHAGRPPHGWAMRAWAHCVTDAAAGLDDGEKLDPEAACGRRPEPPRGAEN